jgi:hypothetical protein
LFGSGFGESEIPVYRLLAPLTPSPPAGPLPHAHARLRYATQGDAGRLIYEFLWDEYADWYIEASKTRMGNAEDAAREWLNHRPPPRHAEQLGCIPPCVRVMAPSSAARRVRLLTSEPLPT